jgi:hypothetical protein
LYWFKESLGVDRSESSFSGEVPFEGSRWVDWIIFFGSVFASKLEDYVAAAGMIGKEVGDVPNRAIQNDLMNVSMIDHSWFPNFALTQHDSFVLCFATTISLAQCLSVFAM